MATLQPGIGHLLPSHFCEALSCGFTLMLPIEDWLEARGRPDMSRHLLPEEEAFIMLSSSGLLANHESSGSAAPKAGIAFAG